MSCVDRYYSLISALCSVENLIPAFSVFTTGSRFIHISGFNVRLHNMLCFCIILADDSVVLNNMLVFVVRSHGEPLFIMSCGCIFSIFTVTVSGGCFLCMHILCIIESF